MMQVKGLMHRRCLFIATALLVVETAPCQQPGVVLWKAPVAYSTRLGGAQIPSSPAIGADGTIYVGAGDWGSRGAGARVYAISPQGTTNWIFRTVDDVRSSPAIGADGTIYVGCMAGYLYAISPSGATNWAFRTGGQILSSPAIGADGTIYVNAISNWFNKLYAMHTDGTTNWVFDLGAVSFAFPFSPQFSSPAIGPDGTIYVGSMNSNLYAIYPNGATRWTRSLGAQTYSSPAIEPDGTIYIGAEDYKLHAIDPQGSRKWEFATGSYVESSPAINSNGNVYIGSLDGQMRVLSAGGALLWNASLGSGNISASPALSSDGTVCFYLMQGSFGALHAFDSSGFPAWSTDPFAWWGFSSPAIGTDGTIYIVIGDSLYALYGTPTLAASSWPMHRHDPRHTARSIQCAIRGAQVLADRTVALSLWLETGRLYRVEASTDLAAWSEIGSFTSTSCSMQFIDSAAPSFDNRFYRLLTAQ